MLLCRIYTSVGYWMSFVFFRVLPQPSISQVKSAPHFLYITTMYNHQRSGVELEEQMYIMLTLVYKGGEFSFEGNLPAVLNDAIVDIDIIILMSSHNHSKMLLWTMLVIMLINYMERVIKPFREVGVVQNLVIYRVLICSILDWKNKLLWK